jgi:large subunit ribosomal protein L21
MYAVLRAGGFQYLVKEGDKLAVPLLDAEPGSAVRFDDVLLLKNEGDPIIGRPKIDNALVEAKVIAHVRNPKITIFKFIKRENYRRKKGHRQPMTEIEIAKIGQAS